jgi:nucleoside-diphosphate-sugar epimerase
LFYGPGTGFDDDWFARARAGKLRLPGVGDDYITLVHIADMADATVTALGHWPSRQALIIADDEPPCWRDLFSTVAALAGVPPPATDGPVRFPSVRASNRRAREILNWRPRYPNHRIGLVR